MGGADLGPGAVGGPVNLLAIETATDLVGAALVAGDHAAERSHQGGRRHAETLIPAIEEVCALPGIGIRDVGDGGGGRRAPGSSPASGWGWPRPRRWPRDWASGSSG